MNTRLPWQGDSARVRDQAARALSEWATALPALAELDVAECLPVFSVIVERARRAKPDTWFEALEWQGQWHCQLDRDAAPTGWARVAETTNDKPLKVLSWSKGGLAEKVHASLSEAGRTLDVVAYDVALVEIPPVGLSALLYVPRSDVTAFVSVLRSATDGRRTNHRALIPLQDALAHIASLPLIRGGEVRAN